MEHGGQLLAAGDNVDNPLGSTQNQCWVALVIAQLKAELQSCRAAEPWSAPLSSGEGWAPCKHSASLGLATPKRLHR